MKTNPELVPLLVVRGAARAIDFYVRALGATVLARYEHGPERHVSHADLELETAQFAVTEELRAWSSDAPPSLGGSPVVLQLNVVDADAALASMRNTGATVVFPVNELFGERMARVRDPFGHIWILRQKVHELSIADIQRQRDELFAKFSGEARPPAPSLPARDVEDRSTLEDSGVARQGPNRAGSRFSAAGRRGHVHLVLGPVGAGKSTFASRLACGHGAVRFALDDWMANLFRQDRPDDGLMDWYVERAARCIEQIWALATAIVALGTDVILEIGLLQRAEREKFYERVGANGLDLTIHVLDAARDVRRKRVTQRNRARGSTFSMVVPPEIFELASDLWEPFEPAECDGRDVRFIQTDGF